MRIAYLILENGAVFKGWSFGYDGGAIGELVFSTGMTGYMETLSDPRYFGQIVIQTFPLIGNYGVIPAEMRSPKLHLNAYIVREWCQEPSNFRSEGNLDSFLCDNKIPGICGVDTRALTRIIRENGAMNAMVSKSPELGSEQWALLRGYRVEGAVSAVCAEREYTGSAMYAPGAGQGLSSGQGRGQGLSSGQGPGVVQGPGSGLNVVLWDFGDTFGLVEGLATNGCGVRCVRFDSSASDISALSPDGVVLSDGPGDPAENTEIIREIGLLCDTGIPLLGVGLGHRLLALARGAKTEKLLFGHHGANQTVSERESGKVFVTSQNHLYSVSAGSPPARSEISYLNANDGSCEGITYRDVPAFSVEFAPTEDVFLKFIACMVNETRSASKSDLNGPSQSASDHPPVAEDLKGGE